MSGPLRYSVGSIGILLVLFGSFLTLWRQADHPPGPRMRTGALIMLAVGGACVALALFGPNSAENGVPPFLPK